MREIERPATDCRFVQLLMIGAAETLLARRVNWPFSEMAERHGMPVVLQVTSGTRSAPSANGWPTYLIEDHVNFTLVTPVVWHGTGRCRPARHLRQNFTAGSVHVRHDLLCGTLRR